MYDKIHYKLKKKKNRNDIITNSIKTLKMVHIKKKRIFKIKKTNKKKLVSMRRIQGGRNVLSQ